MNITFQIQAKVLLTGFFFFFFFSYFSLLFSAAAVIVLWGNIKPKGAVSPDYCQTEQDC
jgi:hypothetical protein